MARLKPSMPGILAVLLVLLVHESATADFDWKSGGGTRDTGTPDLDPIPATDLIAAGSINNQNVLREYPGNAPISGYPGAILGSRPGAHNQAVTRALPKSRKGAAPPQGGRTGPRRVQQRQGSLPQKGKFETTDLNWFHQIRQIAAVTGQRILNTRTASQPMPAAAWLLALGIVGLIGIRRRKHKQP